MNKVQTDNSFVADKTMLRVRHLSKKKDITVLEAFGGDGTIWDNVRNIVKEKNIRTVRIDVKKNKRGTYLIGDNEKFLQRMNLQDYDIIDLDAYGVPIRQIEALYANKTYTGQTVFLTFIQSYMSALPFKMLYKLGFSKNMLEKIPTLFARNGIKRFNEYLSLQGIKKIYIKTHARKNYICIEKGDKQ